MLAIKCVFAILGWLCFYLVLKHYKRHEMFLGVRLEQPVAPFVALFIAVPFSAPLVHGMVHLPYPLIIYPSIFAGAGIMERHLKKHTQIILKGEIAE